MAIDDFLHNFKHDEVATVINMSIVSAIGIIYVLYCFLNK